VPGARGAAVEFMGTEGSLLIDRRQYTFTPRARDAQPVTVPAASHLTEAHVQNFVACARSRATPNSDVVSGHRSALASHLGKQSRVPARPVPGDVGAPARRRHGAGRVFYTALGHREEEPTCTASGRPSRARRCPPDVCLTARILPDYPRPIT